MIKGHIIQITGPVVDVEFAEDVKIPALLNALKIKSDKGEIVLEVAKHLEPGRVRAVSLASTDGLYRGQEISDTGAPISVPVGQEVLGKLFNVLGGRLDGEDTTFKKYWPIHRAAPTLDQQSTKTEVFATGIKV